MLEVLIGILLASFVFALFISIEKLRISVTWRDIGSKKGSFLNRFVDAKSETEVWEWKRGEKKDMINCDFRRK